MKLSILKVHKVIKIVLNFFNTSTNSFCLLLNKTVLCSFVAKKWCLNNLL